MQTLSCQIGTDSDNKNVHNVVKATDPDKLKANTALQYLTTFTYLNPHQPSQPDDDDTASVYTGAPKGLFSLQSRACVVKSVRDACSHG